MNIFSLLLVGAGGFLGSMARYAAVLSVDRKMNSVFPYGTMVVNVLGSFLLGFILAATIKKTGAFPHEWKLFLGTGFCGGFTTFSAFSAQNMMLFQERFPGMAIAYIMMSIGSGLLAVWFGCALAKGLF